MAKRETRTGLWIVGACGAVGSTVALGLAALRRGLSGATGLVSELPPFAEAGLTDPTTFVLGGHEVRGVTLLDAVQEMHQRAGVFSPQVIRACTPALRSMQRNIRPGTLHAASPVVRNMAEPSICPDERTLAATIERLSSDIAAFRRSNRLDRVVVVHAASSEPPAKPAAAHTDPRALKKALMGRDSSVLPASSLYALSAIEAGCAYVNFTPSLGACAPSIRRRADDAGLPYMGCDGKTGESLVKTVLAPMFAMRNLTVLSWAGQNILGNRDGEALDDPKTRASKIRSKHGIVPNILGYEPATKVSIDYLPSLDDWKVAWDFIHFEGFLGVRMSMQFTWQGSDSILAAPLIIDLTRFADLELRRGGGGAMKHLAFFFKDPMDAAEHDLFRQWTRLVAHVDHGSGGPPSSRSGTLLGAPGEPRS